MVMPFYFHQYFNLLFCSINRGREGTDMILSAALSIGKVLSGRRTQKAAANIDTINIVVRFI